MPSEKESIQNFKKSPNSQILDDRNGFIFFLSERNKEWIDKRINQV